MMWKLSRYWNRLAFAIIDLGWALVWDQTGKNTPLIADKDHDYSREILTTVPSRPKATDSVNKTVGE